MYIHKTQNEAESQDSQNENDVRSGPKKNSHIPIIPRKRCNIPAAVHSIFKRTGDKRTSKQRLQITPFADHFAR